MMQAIFLLQIRRRYGCSFNLNIYDFASYLTKNTVHLVLKTNELTVKFSLMWEPYEPYETINYKMRFLNVTAVRIQLPLDIERLHQFTSLTGPHVPIPAIEFISFICVVNFNLFFALLDCKGESSHQNLKKCNIAWGLNTPNKKWIELTLPEPYLGGAIDASAPGSRVEEAANLATKRVFPKKKIIFCANNF